MLLIFIYIVPRNNFFLLIYKNLQLLFELLGILHTLMIVRLTNIIPPSYIELLDVKFENKKNKKVIPMRMFDFNQEKLKVRILVILVVGFLAYIKKNIKKLVLKFFDYM